MTLGDLINIFIEELTAIGFTPKRAAEVAVERISPLVEPDPEDEPTEIINRPRGWTHIEA